MEVEEGRVAIQPLIGLDEAILDDKNRILFSRQKRERLGDTFAVSLCELGCLACYHLSVWEEMVAGLMKFNPLDPTPLRYSEILFNYADDSVKIDPQGRAVLSKRLIKAGKLVEGGPVMIFGRGRRAELWHPEERARYEANRDEYEKPRRDELERAAMQVLERPWRT